MTTHVTKEPVLLDGFQAVLKPGEWGYKLAAVLPESFVKDLEEERESALEWARSKAKNPKRVTVKPVPVVVDTEGTAITDENTPIYSGTMVKLAFFQKPYVLPAGDIGTSLKLKAVQVVSLNTGAGVVDDGDMTPEEATALFGATKGFKVSEPNPVAAVDTEEDEDF